MEKYKGKRKMFVKAIKKELDGVYLHPAIFGMIMNLTFATPNIVEERIFDRFRSIRDLEGVPEWKTFEQIAEYFTKYFHDTGFSISFMPLGVPESIIGSAYFLSEIKNVDPTQLALEPYVFGLLSEIDVQFGRITYACKKITAKWGRHSIDENFLKLFAKLGISLL